MSIACLDISTKNTAMLFADSGVLFDVF